MGYLVRLMMRCLIGAGVALMVYGAFDVSSLPHPTAFGLGLGAAALTVGWIVEDIMWRQR